MTRDYSDILSLLFVFFLYFHLGQLILSKNVLIPLDICSYNGCRARKYFRRQEKFKARKEKFKPFLAAAKLYLAATSPFLPAKSTTFYSRTREGGLDDLILNIFGASQSVYNEMEDMN